jgi:prepilin-type N-terminal cleavage/methylation domain-containing protein
MTTMTAGGGERTRRRTARAMGERGFTLIEMVVTVGIMAILTAAVAAETMPQLPSARASALAQTLTNVATGVQNFRTQIAATPDSLTRLTIPLGQTPGALDICGTPMPSAGWRGPYILANVPRDGLAIGSMVLKSNLGYVAPSGLNSAYYVLTVTGVDRSVVDVMEQQIDVGSKPTAPDLASGTIRWTESPAGSARGTLYYYVGFGSGCEIGF